MVHVEAVGTLHVKLCYLQPIYITPTYFPDVENKYFLDVETRFIFSSERNAGRGAG